MSFIQKNLNTKLLFLLLALILGIAVLTLIYSSSFHIINDKYKVKVEQLNKTFNQLLNSQNIINKTKEELTLKSEREQNLSSQFTDLKQINTKTENQKAQLEKTKEELEKELLDEKRQLLDALDENDNLQQELDHAKKTVREQQDEQVSLKAEISRLNAEGCT